MPKGGPSKRRRGNRRFRRSTTPLVIGGIIVIIIALSAIAFLLFDHKSITLSTSTSLSGTTVEQPTTDKPVILYVNQGNAVVNQSNYPALLSFAKSEHFNTIFFQVYRGGELLFSQGQLTFFVTSAHDQNLSIFLALYFTAPTQQIPASIYGLGEDGISLDMSALSTDVQSNLLVTLQHNYNGKTAVTTSDLASTLKPDLLILETYQLSDRQYIRPGIIASVEPLATTNVQEYQSQFQYALSNSDGVMVFDYYGLLQKGY